MTPRVVILGGGSAGISVAARLAHKLPAGSIHLVEPSDRHYYQPLWTLVGGGEARRETTVRAERDLIPKGVNWVRAAARRVRPELKQVELQDGATIGYDVLVVALGLVCDWARIPGLSETLGKDGVCSNYSYDTVEYTFECIRTHRSGSALFTHPSTPIKCGGAPQKILYLAVDHWNRAGARSAVRPTFCIASAVIFGVPRYAEALMKVVQRESIDVRFQHDLIALKPAAKEAVFRDLLEQKDVVLPYGMIHVTPPMAAPKLVHESGLGDGAGWLDVHRETLQHKRHPEIFGLGDVANLPTSKTGAAIRKQAPIAASNVLAHLAGQPVAADYDGYTSCPLVTGRNRLVLAEFGYEGKIMETFPFDQSKERKSMYLLKKHLLPLMYWKGMLKGRM